MSQADKDTIDTMARDWTRDHDALTARAKAAEAALREIAALRARFHPVAGYQFDVDPRKLARAGLKPTPSNQEDFDARR